MATITKTFTFDSNVQGWAVSGGTADTTLQWASTGGNTGGCLSSRIFGRNKSADPHWYYVGTWEDLGVPVGATVTHIQLLGFDWRCSEYVVASNLTQIRAAKLYDSAGSTQIVQLSTDEPTVSGTTNYATISGAQQAVGASYQASNTEVQLWADLYLRVGNNAAAAVTLLMDNFSVEITYQTGAKEMLPGTGQLVIAGQAPSVSVSDHKTVEPATGELTVAGQAATVVVSDNKNIEAGTGEAFIAGHEPNINVSDYKNIVTETGELVFAGFAPTVSVSDHINVITATGELIATGFAPSIGISGQTKYLFTKTGYYVTYNNMLITIDSDVAGDILMVQEGSDGKYTELKLTSTTTPPTFS